MPLAVSAIWQYVQGRSLDTAASGNAITLGTDPIAYLMLNKAYRIVFNKTSRRSTLEDATVLGALVDTAYGQNRFFLTPQNITEVIQVFASTDGNITVSCSSAALGVTVTTPTDFLAAGVVVGMRVSHANIPGRTFVKSIESATSLTLSDKNTGVITAANVSFRATSGLPMQLEEWGQVLRLHQYEPQIGVPYIYSLRRAQAATLVGVGNIEVLVYPTPQTTGVADNNYRFPMLVRYEIATLSAGTDVPDVEDGEDYLIGDITAYFACILQGRGEIAAAILAELPEYFQEAAKHAAKTLPTKVPNFA